MNPYKEEQDAKRKASLEARCLALHRDHKKVEAVKLYRNEVGCGLREALDAVQRIVSAA